MYLYLFAFLFDSGATGSRSVVGRRWEIVLLLAAALVSLAAPPAVWRAQASRPPQGATHKSVPRAWSVVAERAITKVIVNMAKTMRDVLVEKHFRGGAERGGLDAFLAAVAKVDHPEDVEPILSHTNVHVVNLFHKGVFFLAIVSGEVAPLFVIEFLGRLRDVFVDYFSVVSEDSMRDNFVTVYQLLDEVMDNGYPLTTESGVLKGMIAAPSLLGRAVGLVGGTVKTNVSDTFDGNVAALPWRRRNVKWAPNEVYFDFVEQVDCLVDNNGMIITAGVHGKLECTSRLSGMPDVTVTFQDPSLFDNVSLHPCVRMNRFMKERLLSFVPPDGVFTLMEYSVNRQVAIPVYVKPQISFHGHSGNMNIFMGAKGIPADKRIEGIVITVRFSQNVTTVHMNANVGDAVFNQNSKVLTWTIDRLGKTLSPNLGGTIALARPISNHEQKPEVSASWKIPAYSISGMRVANVSIFNETYKVHKGMRSVTRAGKFSIRT